MSGDNPYSPPNFSTDSFSSSVLVNSDEIRNVKVEINDIFDHAFKTWKENLWLVIGATLISLAITFGFTFFQSFVETVLKGGAQQPPNQSSITFSLLFSISSNIFEIFISIGYTQLLLALLRGRPASLGMLFNGGERLLSTIGVSILLGLAIGIGFILLIIPGIIVILFYWPAYYLVIDRRFPVMQSFSAARAITRGNEVTSLINGLLVLAVMIIGMLAFCIGIIAAQPLAFLLHGCAYLMMSGQMNSRNS